MLDESDFLAARLNIPAANAFDELRPRHVTGFFDATENRERRFLFDATAIGNESPKLDFEVRRPVVP
jgi:hypothetical protein